MEADTDFPTFEALYAGFLGQLAYLARQAMALTDGYEAGYVDRRSAKQRRADAQWEALMSGDYDEDEDEEDYDE